MDKTKSNSELNSDPEPKQSLTDFVAQLVASTKQKKKKATSPTSSSPLYLTTPWTDEAVVLYVQETHCLSCGAVYSAPLHVPFIVRYHPKRGRYSEAINHEISEASWIGLPKRVETLRISAQMCQDCFDPRVLEFELRQGELNFNPEPEPALAEET